VLLLGELVLELLLLHGHRLADLFELLLNLYNSLLHHRCIL
jgi:hypothetical protein